MCVFLLIFFFFYICFYLSFFNSAVAYVFAKGIKTFIMQVMVLLMRWVVLVGVCLCIYSLLIYSSILKSAVTKVFAKGDQNLHYAGVMVF